MPSRPVAVVIVVFWLVTMGLAFQRDVWPRIAASGPPPIAIDLSDEATQYVPIRWKVLRDNQAIGRLETRLAYQDADDTFEFISQYKDLRFEIGPVEISFSTVSTRTRVTRQGQLREQSMSGRMTVGGMVAEARVHGRNENGQFISHCEIDSPLFQLKKDLEPVAVKSGQALNPLQPVNRIVNLRPGQRWTVREIDPLGDALAAFFQEKIGSHGLRLPANDQDREPLLAEVGSSLVALEWGKSQEPAACWVIDYVRGEARARTWVRASDGKVLRQEASLLGDRIALEREE